MNRLRLAALIGVIALVSGLLINRFRQHPVAADIRVDQSITVDGSVRRRDGQVFQTRDVFDAWLRWPVLVA